MTRIHLLLALVLALGALPALASDLDNRGRRDGQSTSRQDRPTLTFREILSRIGIGRKARPPKVVYTRAWVDTQPTASGDEDWACLSEALYFEVRGESVKGQFAVAEVIMNRVASHRFPDTICAVIHQGTGRRYQCQFTYTCDGRSEDISEKAAYARVSKVARAVMDGGGGDLTDGATYYHNRSVRPAWSRKFIKTTSIGVHIFYRPGYRTASSG